MNTITQIENALKAINQASFQTLINHLLYLQGNKFIGAPGAVVGKEKTKRGTPDSFFANEDKYTFVECTTQEKLGESKSFFEKLSKDVDHCFKEDVTTIEKEKIEKIILACNDKVSTKEYNQLNTIVKSYNPEAKFEILNIQNLPLLIFDIPKLAEEYLNIQIIKGDIYTLEQFLLKTKKGLQPSLTNEFIGREEELKNSIEALKRYNILLLSGGPGVGKSKLAVKILEKLSKDDYVPIVIQSSGVSLWDDYQHLFLPGKQYIILFDDANKSITNLNYLLNRLEASQSYIAKVIITSRDYVKKQVSAILDNYSHEEINISEFQDEEIGNIIIEALPNLKYHGDIKRKIVDLAKGNARVALMATYSVTPDSDTNYLSSPVLLYEKYFKKISEEIDIFSNPTILKSLAIVSFFGVLDRNNEELKIVLSTKFGIDWNELWTTVMELHNSEILDVYFEEIVKVSDQVLATYAFYKCFVDDKYTVINYAEWIVTFIEKLSNRISITLIDVNNTFVYHHIKELVLPHLNEVLKQMKSNEELYVFYNLFWFYKGRDCLLYLKKWIESLPSEQHPESIEYSYIHNDHTTASKYFELLRKFWSHSDELLKPSLELTLVLLEKQPSRLSEISKFIHEDFKYKLEDRKNGYLRQNILFDVLLDENQAEHKKAFSNGIFLSIAEVLLGWHFDEFRSGKRMSITISNFDLYKSDELLGLRGRILNYIVCFFECDNQQINKILHKVIHPDGDIDKTIYVDELPIYQKLISEKLDKSQYAHCKFVKTLAEYLIIAGASYPENWHDFIESDIIKLSIFLKLGWEYRNNKPFEDFEKEKREEFDKFIISSDWNSIENLLLDISDLNKQLKNNTVLFIDTAVTDLYISIAKKDREEFKKALRLFFSETIFFPLKPTIINFSLQNNIVTGKDLLTIMDEYEFKDKLQWEFELLTILPKEHISITLLKRLINIFQSSEGNIYVYRMIDYLKYEEAFVVYKKGIYGLENNNIITYLTSVLLSKSQNTKGDFGFHFCTQCAPYFTQQLSLLKAVYLIQKELDSYFDYNGEELEAVLKLDSNFFIEYLEKKEVNEEHLSSKLKSFKLDSIWALPDYERIVEKALDIIIAKSPLFSDWDHSAATLFTFQQNSEELQERALQFLDKYLTKNIGDIQKVFVLLNIVMHRYDKHFIGFIIKFVIQNKDIEIFKRINLHKGGVCSGSRVPYIQEEIDFCRRLIDAVKELPDMLSYSEHLDYLEFMVIRLKKGIEYVQRREFEEAYYCQA